MLQANGPAHVLEPEVSQIVKKLKVKVQDDGTLLQEVRMRPEGRGGLPVRERCTQPAWP